ncbi:hypothetical protein H072_11563 [Dactylellina haptotyla CBS 200.50]|uniref:C2H2-type domain-containing protein n=1 Tax=Dactylellina haptotyla (strain CBS 200.50) TaxID=1284197 RepID=S8BIX8_DACHA|nr:hypothetical protein H072_11563 [Dactylellina haptotyla CBS 200.50]
MASNYYTYPYGNTTYSQSQPSVQEPDSNTAAQPSSQSYYESNQAQSRQPAANSQQLAPEARSRTTQYNGLHFPTPAPARQTQAAGRFPSAAANAGASSSAIGGGNVSGGGAAAGYGSQGLYKSTETAGHQSVQRNSGTAAGTQGYGTHSQPASTARNAGTSGSVAGQRVSQSAADSNYSYAYPQQDSSSHQSYYAPQRVSNSSRATQLAAQAQSAVDYDQSLHYGGSSHQVSSKSSQSVSQTQPTQTYRQPAQSAAKGYENRYDLSATRTDTTTPNATNQQAADYGRNYQDDGDQNQSYLHQIYTLPQPTPTRGTADSTRSYFSNVHATETPYSSSAPPAPQPKPSPGRQSAHDRSQQNSDINPLSSATNFNHADSSSSIKSTPQYNQIHSSSATTQRLPAPDHHSFSTTKPIAASSSVPILQPTALASASKVKKPRQTGSQKSPTTKTPKPRAPRKPKASTAAAAATTTTSEMPKQHTFFPPVDNASDSSGMAKQASSALQISAANSSGGQPVPAASSSPALEIESMEQHMREMVEKMREYQSRDPTAFQQVWENVKRAGPGGAGGKASTPTPTPTPTAKTAPNKGSPHQATSNLAKTARTTKKPTVATTVTSSPASAAAPAEKTHWPSDQKVALSQATSKFFKNIGQNCSESFVMSLLDYGPTFAELCQKLSAQGYKFDGSKLALVLLKISETSDSSSTKGASESVPAMPAATLSSTMGSSATNAALDPPSRSLAPQSIKSFTPRNIKDSIPAFALQDQNIGQPQSFVAPSMIYQEVYTAQFSQPESNVRSDDYIAPSSPVVNTNAPTPQEKPVSKSSSTKKRVSLAKPSQKPPQTPHAALSLPLSLPQPQITPQPLTTREERMVDTETVATSQPPTPLGNPYQASTPVMLYVPSQAAEENDALARVQSKLDAQMSRSKQIELPSHPLPKPPVATLPSQPPAPLPAPPTRKPVLPKPPALDSRKALRRNTYDPQNIVHAVLLATGRHPNYEGLNSGFAILKRLHPDVFDNSVDLARIDWDLYDPPPGPGSGPARKTKNEHLLDEEDTRGRKRESVPFTPRTLQMEPGPSTPVSVDGRALGKRGRPRGRPRGSRGVARAGRGGRSGTGTPTDAGYTTEHPKSTEDSSTSASAHKYGVTRVNINSLGVGANGNGGAGGRKRKHGDSPHSRRPSDASHWSNGQSIPVFKCQWEKCNHELQNLETLRRHLLKKHKVENAMGVMPCCWGDCGSIIPVESLNPETGKKIIESRRKRLNFGTGAAWDNHVIGEHLKMVKATLGEGMSIKTARSLSRESSAHSVEGRIRSMSRDRNGRSITPVITSAPFGYKFTPPPGFAGGSQFRRAHDFDNGFIDEKKLLEEELARTEQLGAGLETHGTVKIPGIEYDDGSGYLIKARKLTNDLSLLPPHSKIKNEEVEGLRSPKGKRRAS